MASEPKMPIGRSRWGFLVSSAAVGHDVEPDVGEEDQRRAGEDAADAEGARAQPEILQQALLAHPPGAGLEPEAGMNGCQLPALM